MFLRLLIFSIISFLVVVDVSAAPKVMLGIDVLESMQFKPLRYKRVGLLTHPAGVNRNGRSTVDILYRARNVKLVALFGPEHGIYGDEKADVPVLDKKDRRTGLPVFSLYGKYRKPTPYMLSKIDVLVIDLQDIGCRSYTYISFMLRAMEACFENGKEVMILDRPNPLGGLKVDGPTLDKEFKSYVGMFQVPYVHGMTIGELARFAKYTRGAMEITSNYQRHGKLTVIPMRGWKRNMLWSDTGLRWKPTSPAIPTFSAALGYSMTGLGCQLGGFQHGYGTTRPFRLLTFPNKTPEQIKANLDKYRIRGVSFVPAKAKSLDGKKLVNGLYVVINNWSALRPTELSFYLMKLTCIYNNGNVFRYAPKNQALLFNKHTGSREFWQELSNKGAYTDISWFIQKWEINNTQFKKISKKYHLYK
ncbi:MAG: DUF1343 domain-containing protein [Opitutales bacterium]|nr:DUF1343 domain-containing protein [Opitutales bacterium]